MVKKLKIDTKAIKVSSLSLSILSLVASRSFYGLIIVSVIASILILVLPKSCPRHVKLAYSEEFADYEPTTHPFTADKCFSCGSFGKDKCFSCNMEQKPYVNVGPATFGPTNYNLF